MSRGCSIAELTKVVGVIGGAVKCHNERATAISVGIEHPIYIDENRRATVPTPAFRMGRLTPDRQFPAEM